MRGGEVYGREVCLLLWDGADGTRSCLEAKRYPTELVASGDASEGICPLVEVHLDGQKVAEVQLTTEGWRAYPLSLALDEGQHELAIYFVNDHYAPTGDRNLRLDKMVFYGD